MINLRKFENSRKFGYLFFIQYNGKKIDSFDENSGKRSVKGDFIKGMTEMGISWAKGVQQASRTDSEVSAQENILYFSSNFSGDMNGIIQEFNKKNRYLQIISVKKTYPDIVIPDYVEYRVYKYEIPEKYKITSINDIEKRCKELSGTYDVSRFSDEKGDKLKEKVRSVEVKLEDGALIFKGNSFMPKQVRNMSGYILSGEIKLLPGHYLSLIKNGLNSELVSSFLERDEEKIDGVEVVEKNNEIYLFYVKKEKRGEFIGKNGSNIKKIRKQYGKVVVRDFY